MKRRLQIAVLMIFGIVCITAYIGTFLSRPEILQEEYRYPAAIDELKQDQNNFKLIDY